MLIILLHRFMIAVATRNSFKILKSAYKLGTFVYIIIIMFVSLNFVFEFLFVSSLTSACYAEEEAKFIAHDYIFYNPLSLNYAWRANHNPFKALSSLLQRILTRKPLYQLGDQAIAMVHLLLVCPSFLVMWTLWFVLCTTFCTRTHQRAGRNGALRNA